MAIFRRKKPVPPTFEAPWADTAWHLVKPVEHCLIASEKDGVIVAALGNVVGVSGWTSEDLLGQPLVTVIPERHHAMHNHGFGRFLATGEAPALGYTFATDAQGPDREFPVWLTAFGLNPKSKLVLGLLERRVPEETPDDI